jgi:hypothetical protein
MESKNQPSRESLKFPKPDVVLFTFQVLLIFVVVCVSLMNLSLQWGNQNLWTVVLTGSLGYIMPNPKLKISNGSVSVNELKAVIND